MLIYPAVLMSSIAIGRVIVQLESINSEGERGKAMEKDNVKKGCEGKRKGIKITFQTNGHKRSENF